MIEIKGKKVSGTLDDGKTSRIFSKNGSYIRRIVDIAEPAQTSKTRIDFYDVSLFSGDTFDHKSKFFRDNAKDIYEALESVGAEPPRVSVPISLRFKRLLADTLPEKTLG